MSPNPHSDLSSDNLSTNEDEAIDYVLKTIRQEGGKDFENWLKTQPESKVVDLVSGEDVVPGSILDRLGGALTARRYRRYAGMAQLDAIRERQLELLDLHRKGQGPYANDRRWWPDKGVNPWQEYWRIAAAELFPEKYRNAEVPGSTRPSTDPFSLYNLNRAFGPEGEAYDALPARGTVRGLRVMARRGPSRSRTRVGSPEFEQNYREGWGRIFEGSPANPKGETPSTSSGADPIRNLETARNRPSNARLYLNRALGNTSPGRTGPRGHHLVPLEMATEHPEVLDAAARGGFNINGANNGLKLPYQMHQQGYYHPRYNAVARRLLDKILNDMRTQNLSDEEVAQRVQAVADSFRAILQQRINDGRLEQLR